MFLKILFIYLLLDRGEGKEKERERNINVWLPLMSLPLGTRPATQACALTGNGSKDLSVCRPALSPLSHISQGERIFLLDTFYPKKCIFYVKKAAWVDFGISCLF